MRIVVPPAVIRELSAPSTPAATLEWTQSPPEWLRIRAPQTAEAVSKELDDGEREAIALAGELHAKLVLIDDWDGRREARRLRLEVVGTLGVMLAAARRDLLDFERSLGALEATSFHMSEQLKAAVLNDWRKGSI